MNPEYMAQQLARHTKRDLIDMLVLAYMTIARLETEKKKDKKE